MVGISHGALSALKTTIATYSSPSLLPQGVEPKQAAKVLQHAVLCVLALTYGSVVRSHRAVKVGMLEALSDALKAARLTEHGTRYSDKLSLVHDWLSNQKEMVEARKAPTPPTQPQAQPQAQPQTPTSQRSPQRQQQQQQQRHQSMQQGQAKGQTKQPRVAGTSAVAGVQGDGGAFFNCLKCFGA